MFLAAFHKELPIEVTPLITPWIISIPICFQSNSPKASHTSVNRLGNSSRIPLNNSPIISIPVCTIVGKLSTIDLINVTNACKAPRTISGRLAMIPCTRLPINSIPFCNTKGKFCNNILINVFQVCNALLIILGKFLIIPT